jgi:hypothetical protein
MKNLTLLAAATFALPPLAPGNAAPRPAPSAKAPQVLSSRKADYARRVRAVSSQWRASVAVLWAQAERYEDARQQLLRPARSTRRASSVDESELQKEVAEARAKLLSAVKAVRANSARVSSLSPVPRAWKKSDDRLIEASLLCESALLSLEAWLSAPSTEAENEFRRQMRRARTLIETTERELVTRTNPTFLRKQYTD